MYPFPIPLLLFALLACAAPARQAPARLTCRVARVSDGDTFHARCPDDVRIRLLLIDAPERDQPPFGREAWTRLERLLPVGSTVTLEADVQPRDQFGRTLAYVYDASGHMVNEEMVRSGYAVPLVYAPNVRYVERIRAAAADAQRERRGLWQTGGFACTPKDHRRQRC
jgi:micrococcal nuclease